MLLQVEFLEYNDNRLYYHLKGLSKLMNGYQSSQAYWDHVFEKSRQYNPYDPLPYPEIEAGLDWLSADGGRLLDFASGSGRTLLRCLALGARSGIGIDLSAAAVKMSRSAAQNFDLAGQADFQQGGAEQLAHLDSGSFDGVILFNILDNLLPGDARAVAVEIQRLLAPRGKLLIKLNAYQSPRVFEQDRRYIPLGDGVYQESSGLFFWNLSGEQFEALLSPGFVLEREVTVPFPEYQTANRMYYLTRS